MKNLIRNIKEGQNIDLILQYILNRLYTNGPIHISDMEILSYLSLYQAEKLFEHKDSIINYMGLFYKETAKKTLKDVVFGQYKIYISDTFLHTYTPIQAEIVKGLIHNQCLSFSAPTSTGKSFVFINEIMQCQGDVVVIVPSRALINEYYLKLRKQVQTNSENRYKQSQ